MNRSLVIEDEWDISFIICKHLQMLGFETDSTNSVQGAISQIDTTEHKLYVVDIGLIDGSGLEVIKVIHEKKPQAKLIVISAYQNEVAKALSLGAHFYIVKPFSIKSLNAALGALNLL
jgi:DNA-binding response OmpR family regulator